MAAPPHAQEGKAAVRGCSQRPRTPPHGITMHAAHVHGVGIKAPNSAPFVSSAFQRSTVRHQGRSPTTLAVSIFAAPTPQRCLQAECHLPAATAIPRPSPPLPMLSRCPSRSRPRCRPSGRTTPSPRSRRPHQRSRCCRRPWALQRLRLKQVREMGPCDEMCDADLCGQHMYAHNRRRGNFAGLCFLSERCP